LPSLEVEVRAASEPAVDLLLGNFSGSEYTQQMSSPTTREDSGGGS
jgi:hypothetical protein